MKGPVQGRRGAIGNRVPASLLELLVILYSSMSIVLPKSRDLLRSELVNFHYLNILTGEIHEFCFPDFPIACRYC